jgi:hypothetical protein
MVGLLLLAFGLVVLLIVGGTHFTRQEGADPLPLPAIVAYAAGAGVMLLIGSRRK